MNAMKDRASRCVVIGDLVGSRSAPNRRALHRAVEKALVSANAAVPAVTELRITVGDEFQGAYATLGAAIEAALRVRLELLPTADVRVGIGRGPVQLLDAERGIEDGPGWWAARSAIEAVEQAAGRPATCAPRTTRRPSSTLPPTPASRTRAAVAVTRMPSTRHCSVGTIWLARCH